MTSRNKRKLPVMPLERQVYTIPQFAAVLEISVSTVYRMIKHNQISASKIGNVIRIPVEEVHKLLKDKLICTGTTQNGIQN